MDGRLPWIEPAEFDADQRAFYDYLTQEPRLAAATERLPLADETGRLYGPFNVMIASPTVGAALHQVGGHLRHRAGYSDRVREIAVLELAVIRRSATEWHAHEPYARNGVLTDEEITAIRMSAPAPTFDAAETVARKVVQSLLRSKDIDDALYAEASAAFGPRVLIELVMLILYFDLLATTITTFRAAIPAGKPSPFG
jgi:hypothetical protein